MLCMVVMALITFMVANMLIIYTVMKETTICMAVMEII